MPVKLETNAIRTIAAFEKITKVHARDCMITDDYVYFVVDSEKMGLAVGKNGVTIKEVSKILGKPVKLFGYKDTPEEFIKNAITGVKSINISNGSVLLTVEPKIKVMVIGRNGGNIKAIKELLRRHFSIENIRLR
jgi:N utilization substance protein A